MKLSMLYEYLDLVPGCYGDAPGAYCDPKGKAKKLNIPGGKLPKPGSKTKVSENPPDVSKSGNGDTSHLVGQKKDRNRFLSAMNTPRKKK